MGGGSDSIIMARDTNVFLADVNAVMKPRVPKSVEFLEWIRDRLRRGQNSLKFDNPLALEMDI